MPFADPYTAAAAHRGGFTDPYADSSADLVRMSDAAGRSEFGKGWEAAGVGEELNAKLAAANQEEIDGNYETAKVLRKQAKDLAREAAITAPSVQNMTDVNGLGDAARWAMGSAGNLRSSIKPMVAGLAGAAVGTVAAPFTGGIINPVTASMGAATAAGWKPNRDEIIANAMQSGTEASPQEIRSKANAYSIPVSMLDGVVPAGAGKLISGFGKGAMREALAIIDKNALEQATVIAARSGKEVSEAEVRALANKIGEGEVRKLAYKLEGEEIAKDGIAKFIAKGAVKDAGEEGITEGLQDVLGQAAVNDIDGKAPLANIDWKQALNSGAAGAAPGAAMGGMNHAGSVARHQMGAAKDLAQRVADNPAQAAANLLADAGAKAGDLVDHFKRKTEDKALDELAADLERGRREQDAPVNDFIKAKIDPQQDATATDDMMRTNGLAAAEAILSAPGPEYSQTVRKAAADFKTGKIEWNEFHTIAGKTGELEAAMKKAGNLLTSLGGKKKYSLMSPTLTDDFGEQEGRSTEDDTVTDDQGNLVGRDGAILMHHDQSSPNFNYDSIQRSAAVEAAKNAPVEATTQEVGAALKGAGMPVHSETMTPGPKQVQQQKLTTVADVLYKHGVSEKLLESAKNGNVKEADMQAVTGLLGWMQDGMSDPATAAEGMAKFFGGSAKKLFDKAYEIATHDGLITKNPDLAASISQQIGEHAGLTAKTDKTIEGALSYSYRQRADGDLRIPEIREVLEYAAKNGINKKAEQHLVDNYFGTKDNLNEALDAIKLNQQKSKAMAGVNELAADGTHQDAEGNTVDADGNAYYGESIGDESYGTGMNEQEGSDKVLHGYKGTQSPYNLKSSDEAPNVIARDKERLTSGMGTTARNVGIVTYARENSEDVTAAEDELLQTYAKNLAQDDEYAGLVRDMENDKDIGDLTKAQRERLLSMIDKQFRYLEVQHAEGAANPHNISDIQKLKYKNMDVAPKDMTAQMGVIFLERRRGKQVSFFPIKVEALLKHSYAAEKAEPSIVNGMDGAAASMQHFMVGISDVLGSDSTFTGRLGYRTQAGAKLKMINGGQARFVTDDNGTRQVLNLLNQLPNELNLGRNGSVSDAKSYMADALMQGDKNEVIPFATTLIGMRKALIEYGKTASKYKQDEIKKAFKAGKEAVQSLYLSIRNQWSGSLDALEQAGNSNQLESDGNGGFKKPDTKKPSAMEQGKINRQAELESWLNRYEAKVDKFGRDGGLAPLAQVVREALLDGSPAKIAKAQAAIQEMRVKHRIDGRLMTKEEVADAMNFDEPDNRPAFEHDDHSDGKTQSSNNTDEAVQDSLLAERPAGATDNEIYNPKVTPFPQQARLDALEAKHRSSALTSAERSEMLSLREQEFAHLQQNQMGYGSSEGAIQRADDGMALGTGADAALYGGRGGVTGRRVQATDEKHGKPDAKGVTPGMRNSDREALANDPAARQRVGQRVKKGQMVLPEWANSANVTDQRLDAKGKGLTERTPAAAKADPVVEKLQSLKADQFDLRDWFADTLLNKGIPAVIATSKKLTDPRMLNVMERGLDLLLKKDPVALNQEVYNGKLSDEQLATIFSRANEVAKMMGVEHVVRNTGREASGGGQSNAVGKQDRATVDADANQSRTDAKANVGAEPTQLFKITKAEYEKLSKILEDGHDDDAVYDKAEAAIETLDKEFNAAIKAARDMPFDEKINELEKLLNFSNETGLEEGNLTAIDELIDAIADLAVDYKEGEVSVDVENLLAQLTPIMSQEEIENIRDEVWDADANNPEAIIGILRDAQAQLAEFKERQGRLFSKQNPEANQAKTDEIKAKSEEAKNELLKIIGDAFELKFGKFKFAGSWERTKAGKALIHLSTDGDIKGTAFHEAFHEVMQILRENGGEQTIAAIERAAMSPIMQRKLKLLLKNDERALKQLNTPEEAAAFMFQFWKAGDMKIGPEAKSFFQKVVDFGRQVLALFSEAMRTKMQAEKKGYLADKLIHDTLQAIGAGALANTDTRSAVVEALNADTVKQEKAIKRVDGEWTKLANTYGKLVFSAEAMMDASNNPHIAGLARMFHQKVGTGMKKIGEVTGGFFDAVRYESNARLNQLEDTLAKYDKDTLEAAREYLAKGTDPSKIHVAEIKQAYNDIRAYFDEMAIYLTKRDVRRLEKGVDGKPRWVPVNLRGDYYPQVFSVKAITDNTEKMIQELIDNHPEHLKEIAINARREYRAKNKIEKEDDTVTDDDIKNVAAHIVSSLLNSNGQIDINEDISDLGITPVAAAVNRRKLDWLNPDVFDKYMEKDVAKVMTTYTRNMVKRAEYQSRFGYGGEKISSGADWAKIHEIGGEDMTSQIKSMAEEDEHKNKSVMQLAQEIFIGKELTKPEYRGMVDQEARQKAFVAWHAELAKAVETLEPSFRAIQALEGTLGRDITPSMRAVNSWITTYQNFRVLSMMLFTSTMDVVGVTINGGSAKDAWNTFVSGMREVVKSWRGEKSMDAQMLRAERWGAVDAGVYLSALGETFNSVYMTEGAKHLSDRFFKAIGAEGWNRGIRSAACSAAENLILDWKNNGVDLSDPAVKARFERLYGEGATLADVKLDKDGQLDINDEANRAAINRWVLDALPAPNAAHRPIWGSDPHYQTFMHLKNYTYSMHRIILKNVADQAMKGNFQPAAVAALGYMPIAIAAGAIKEMLIPGDEPAWMKGGLGSYLSYGWQRAGVLGVPQMYAENLWNFDPAAIFGPTMDEVQNMAMVPFSKSHTFVNEVLSDLPMGNLARRLSPVPK